MHCDLLNISSQSVIN